MKGNESMENFKKDKPLLNIMNTDKRKFSKRIQLWKDDLNYLIEELETYKSTFHDVLIKTDTLSLFENKIKNVDLIKENITFLDDKDIKINIQKTLALPNDGHSAGQFIYKSSFENPFVNEVIPLHFEYLDKEIWCVGSYLEKYADIVNSKLISINGNNIIDIFEKFKNLTGYDNIYNAQSKFIKIFPHI